MNFEEVNFNGTLKDIQRVNRSSHYILSSLERSIVTYRPVKNTRFCESVIIPSSDWKVTLVNQLRIYVLIMPPKSRKKSDSDPDVDLQSFLKRLDTRLDDFSAELVGVRAEIKDVKDKLDSHGQSVSELAERVETLEQDVAQKTDRIGNLEKDNDEHKRRITEIEKVLQSMNLRVSVQDQYSKRDNLLFAGLKLNTYANSVRQHATEEQLASTDALTVQENAALNDNDSNDVIFPRDRNIMLQNFVSFVRNKMGIEVQPADIMDIHPIHHKSSQQNINNAGPASSPATIVVRFNNRRVRDQIYYSRKKLYNSDVYINEHLSKTNADIFKEARKLKKDNKITSTWTKNCQVIIKLNNEKKEVKSIKQLHDVIANSDG